jgi:hypothetical protein
MHLMAGVRGAMASLMAAFELTFPDRMHQFDACDGD